MTLAGIDPAAASAAFLSVIPREFARDHALLSQGLVSPEHTQEWLVVSEQTDRVAIHNVGVRLGRLLQIRTGDPESIVAAIDVAYERAASQRVAASPGTAQEGGDAVSKDAEATHGITISTSEEDIDVLLERADRDLLSTAGKAPLIRLVDRLLFQALQRGASDLHIQPLADRVMVRHRIDGVLDDGFALPQRLLKPISSRIKVMGRMDVAEHLVPQDGRATVVIGSRSIDLRISTLPTAYGERAVMRLLDSTRQLADVPSLGMPTNVSEPFLAAAKRAHGIILVTGPTGSGKTTTLYSTLRQLDARERNIMTIEDPIEYELSAVGCPISQTQVNGKKGVTFANGLRHILRQDPDVIMVGEIRDAETARIAIQSSLTGHLVFSTLHTNDSVSAITRLIDLGVEPYLVTASLSTVVAQRLVRTLCSTCTGSGQVDARSCPDCHGTGHRGRTGVFELLVLTDTLRAAVATGASLDQLRRLAISEGMRSLAMEGARLVAEGRTSAAEVDRVISG